MQEKVKQYFLSRLGDTRQSIEKLRRTIYTLGTVRLLIVIATITFSYFLRSQGIFIVGGLIFIGTVIFLFILQKWNQLQEKMHYLETSADCDKNESDALDYRFDAFNGCPERINAGHQFSLDLDIFGNHSLFQSINRTSTAYGTGILADRFNEPELSSETIRQWQRAIEELSKKPDFLHHFQVTGRMNRENDFDEKEIQEFYNPPRYISHYKWWRVLHYALPAIWVMIVFLCIFNIISPFQLIIFYLVTLFTGESRVKKINQLHTRIGRKAAILTSYSKLFKAVEQESFESEIPAKLQSCFVGEGKPASAKIAQLAKYAGELDQRSNLMVHLIFNPLLLWDIHKAMQIDSWMLSWGGYSVEWIMTAGEMDAFVSLASFAFTHPDYTFPEFTDNYFTLKGKNLGHPLMKRETCVRNDIDITNHPYFLIITGANMSGKSTYLRTIGVNLVLACLGVPVCADALLLSPVALFTGLRTSDSLNDNESYFFAELKRLKMIIDRLEAGEKLFIILDEILKGTNSVDKQKGSLALIQQFVRLQSRGIIATHDLQLGRLETEFPDRVKNYHFEADIINDELSFSYRLQEGIVQNMNACFLMKKMGITLPD